MEIAETASWKHCSSLGRRFGLNGRFGNSRTGELDVNIFFNYSTGNVIINGTKLASSFRSGSRTGYNLNNDFRLGNRYTWIDPKQA